MQVQSHPATGKRRPVLLLLPVLFVCSHCSAPEPGPAPNPSTDSAMMGPDEPVPVPQPAPSTEAGDPPEIPVENHSPPLASAGPQAGWGVAVALQLTTMVLSGTRGAWIGTALGMVVLAVLLTYQRGGPWRRG